MIGFKKCILVEEDFQPEFVCNRVCREGRMRYFISVQDMNGNPKFFTMEEKGDIWEIINNRRIAPWIKELEILLDAAIRENHLLNNIPHHSGRQD